MRAALDVLGGWALKSGLPDAGGVWAGGGNGGDDDSHEPHERARYRAVFISDLHLGTAGCQADLLCDFLHSIECETLYLVGDIVDGWRLRKGWYWPSILDLARSYEDWLWFY